MMDDVTANSHIYLEWLVEKRLIPALFYTAASAVVFTTALDTGFSEHTLSMLKLMIGLLVVIPAGILLIASLTGLISYFIFLPSISEDGHLFSTVHGRHLIHPLNTSIVLGLAALNVFTGSKAGGAIWMGLFAIHLLQTGLIVGHIRREQLMNGPTGCKTGSLFLLFTVLFGTEAATLAGGVKSLPPWCLDRLPEDTWIVDVRTKSEFHWNRLQGAENYPWGTGVIGAATEKSKDRPVLVTCLSGHRSPSIAVLLRRSGFKNVYNLNWGLLYLILLERGKRRDGPFSFTRSHQDHARRGEDLRGITMGYITFGALMLIVAPLEHALRHVRVFGLQQVLGVLIGLTGLTLVVFSYRALGRNFRFYAAPRRSGKLVTSGVYSKVRHPMYTGVITMFVGWILLFGSLLSVPLYLPFCVLYMVKAVKEERILIDRFPEYEEYRKRTWRFLPYVY